MFANGKHLLLALHSGRLYLLCDDDLRKAVVVSGVFADDPEFIEVVEVTSSLTLSVASEGLAPHLVPDHRVYQELRALKITGLRRAVSLHSSVQPLPLAGNLTNPEWLSVCLGGRCDSKCVFCFTEAIRNDRGLEFEEVVKSLECGRQKKVSVVVFSGGEPTLCKDLIRFINLANQLGYAQIEIQTNGHRLARKEYLRSLIDAGLTSALVSLHAPSAVTHNRLTRMNCSFERAIQGLMNLSDSIIDFTINFVVCRDNGPLAVKMVEFVAEKFQRAALRFSFLIVEGGAFDYLRNDLPTLPEFVNWIGPALALADELSVVTEVENIPPCISHLLGTPETYSRSRRRSLMDASPFNVAHRDRGEFDVKLAACASCNRSDNCSGLQMAYLANTPDGADHVFPIHDG